jgi:hypothetical protein
MTIIIIIIIGRIKMYNIDTIKTSVMMSHNKYCT